MEEDREWSGHASARASDPVGHFLLRRRQVGEFDGRDPHMRKRVHDYDSKRRNDFTSAGWLRFGITAAALQSRDGRAFRQVARALAR